MLSRTQALKNIFTCHEINALYVINTGFLSRAVYNLYPNKKNILYMQGSMGLGPCIGLGLALNTKKQVVVISGDGSLLMHLGITHTIRDCNLSNLFLYVLDNGCHESVGSYPCAPLEKSYPGVHKIITINNEGRCQRVGVNFIENKENFIEAI